MNDLVPVRVRDCACPDAPHVEEGDIVYLLPMLGLEGGLAAEADNSRALVEAMNAMPGRPNEEIAVAAGENLRRRWLITFVRYGAKSWNFLDEDGQPMPFDVNVILDDYRLGQPVADQAADLYAETVNRPLVASVARASQRGRTNGSRRATRAPRSSSPKRRGSSSPAASAGPQSVTGP